MKTAEIVVAIGDSVSDTTQKTTENTTMMSTRDHGKVNIDFEASIDTTTSFKYMRNLEKVFESIPESIPQLVFFMTTSFNTATGQESINDDISLLIIPILSILQSIISMTNSVVKNDNAQMKLPKFKQHHQRLPSTKVIIYRIGLLSLKWTVCQGTVQYFQLFVRLKYCY